MTLKLYTDLANEARRNVAKFGRSVTVFSGATLTHNIVEGSVSGTRVGTVHKAVVSTNAGKLMSDVRMIGNSSVMTTDVKLVFGPDVSIDDNDKIEVDGIEWAILKKIITAPGDLRVMTTVWLRR